MSLVAYATSDDSDDDSIQDGINGAPTYLNASQANLEESECHSSKSKNAKQVLPSDSTVPCITSQKDALSVSTIVSCGDASVRAGLVSSQTESAEIDVSNSSHRTTMQLPAPKDALSSAPVNETAETDWGDDIDMDLHVSSIFSGLPVNKTSFKEDMQPEPSSELELEDIVKPSAAELALQQKPKQNAAKKSRTVKITVPSLASFDNECDDEAGPAKRQKRVKGTSGLFSLLPAPKGEAGAVESSNPFIPHSIAKKQAQPSNVVKEPAILSSPHASVLTKSSASSHASVLTTSTKAMISQDTVSVAHKTSQLASYDDSSDDDDNNAGFFSLNSKPDTTVSVTNNISSLRGNVDISRGLPSSVAVPSASTSADSDAVDRDDDDVTEVATLHVDPDNLDAPLQFSQGSVLCVPRDPWGAGPSQSPVEKTGGVEAQSWSDDGAAQSWESNDEYLQPQLATDDNNPGYPDIDEYIHNEQFQRLQGSRKQRSKSELQIIDVRADDLTSSSVDRLKTVSEEVVPMTSHSKKHNKDMPTSQQKRKHQITYLAFQAKERELSLKNQWAENKFNKRQTQSKYGF